MPLSLSGISIHNLRYNLNVWLEGLRKSMKVRTADLVALDFQKNGRPKIHNEDLNSPHHTEQQVI
jgi:hypothetical protein